MISLETFLNSINKNVKRINAYKLGYDGSDGFCDCIGLIIGAVRLSGEKWTGIHGSNYAVRNEISELEYIESKNQLYVGEVLFKAHAPGESGYNLPSRYKDDIDQNDYYHVGIVTSVNPVVITHCTGVDGGIKKDTSLGKWHYGGKLSKVNYEGDVIPVEVENMTVTGGSLNMRSLPDKTSNRIAIIPNGSVVAVIDKTNIEWYKAIYNEQTGYVMSKYLIKNDGDDEEEGNISIVLNRETANILYESLKNALNR